jgi:hypothetical protein
MRTVEPPCQVVCPCRKVITSFKEWVSHLKQRHPKLYGQQKADGTLWEDQEIFRRSREVS